MLGTLFKVIFIAAIVFAITAGIGLVIMAGVASTHDVKAIEVPHSSSLYVLSEQWDYADAFRRPMEFASYRAVADMIPNIPAKGDGELHRDAKEIVYTGTLPGLQYQVAYMLDRDSFPPALNLVTVYRFKNKQGRYFWKIWKPVHRALAPYLLDRLGSAATS
jgi:hypothetical protein